MKQTYYRDSVLNRNIYAGSSVIKHLVVESFGVNETLMTTTLLENLLNQLCVKLDLHVIKRFKHSFSPFGDTMLYLLEESHLALHSWPENGYLHLDFVTCQTVYPDLRTINQSLQKFLSPSHVKIYKMRY